MYESGYRNVRQNGTRWRAEHGIGIKRLLPFNPHPKKEIKYPTNRKCSESRYCGIDVGTWGKLFIYLKYSPTSPF